MRKAVTTLQSAHQFYGGSSSITPDAVREMSGGVPDGLVQSLWEAISTQSFDNLKAQCDEVEMAGYPTMAVLHRLFDLVVAEEGVEDAKKAVVMAGLARAEKLIIDGASESLQLLDICALMMRTFLGKNRSAGSGVCVSTPMVL
jgi:DNA polymerase III gamma/tau subunit